MNIAYRLSRFITVACCSLLLAACGGGGGGSSTPSAASTPGPLSINLTVPFNDTKVALTAGETVTITATGSFNTGQCPQTSCDDTASGQPWSTCANVPPPAFTAPGLACYSLIGKIGSAGTPFEVGSSLVLTAPSAGELYLGVNDNIYYDNTGSLFVTIVPS
jgi:hypothetical protein